MKHRVSIALAPWPIVLHSFGIILILLLFFGSKNNKNDNFCVCIMQSPKSVQCMHHNQCIGTVDKSELDALIEINAVIESDLIFLLCLLFLSNSGSPIVVYLFSQ